MRGVDIGRGLQTIIHWQTRLHPILQRLNGEEEDGSLFGKVLLPLLLLLLLQNGNV